MSAGSKQSHAVAILGAGLAGLAAAQRLEQLGHTAQVFEKNAYVGGHAYSHPHDGFVFDEGPHVSFTKRPEIQELFARSVDGKFWEHDARITNAWQGRWIKHPAQCNLHGLPPELVTNCIADAARAHALPEASCATYADWCHQGLGKAFSEEFTFRYTRKYWTVEAEQMSTDWVGSRVYRPKLEEMVRGAIAPESSNHHYLNRFRYPHQGGFAAYTQAVTSGQPVHCRHGLELVDLRRRELEFANGYKHSFDTLISSLPMPELIKRIKDVPREVAEAATKLVCTSLALVNLGIERDEGFPDAHWMYFYDDDVVFSRGNLPHRLSPANAPPGCGSLQLEIYYSKYKPLECRDVLTKTIEDLQRLGMLHSSDSIRVAQAHHIPYANVLFDLERAPNLKIVQDYLERHGIQSCGRYGEWAYLWSDDSVVSGWQAAERAADALQTIAPIKTHA